MAIDKNDYMGLGVPGEVAGLLETDVSAVEDSVTDIVGAGSIAAPSGGDRR